VERSFAVNLENLEELDGRLDEKEVEKLSGGGEAEERRLKKP